MAEESSSRKFWPAKKDLAWAIPVGIIAGITVFKYGSPNIGNKNIMPLALSIATISGTLIGFLLTTTSLLINISDTRLMKNLYQSGHLADMTFSGLFQSIILYLVTLIAAILFNFCPDTVQCICISYLIGSFSSSLVAFLLSGRRIFHILLYAKRPSE
ncbi:MAG: hypothetical protein HQL86_02005 [Magnetococcales bacterium]|nr:hypothetical protein [Magnetococcales bacterium]